MSAERKRDQPETIAPPGLSIDTGNASRSSNQQLFSFPKRPTTKTPTSPLFHLQLDTESRKESSQSASPTSFASSPSFQTFLQARPSTSTSAADGRPTGLLAFTCGEDQPPSSSSKLHATVEHDEHPESITVNVQPDLNEPLPTGVLQGHFEGITGHREALPPTRGLQGRSEGITKRGEVPIPESLPSRAIPLFGFLKDDATSEKVAVEGLLEWIDYWVKRGTRVRALSRELEIVKAEVRSSYRVLSRTNAKSPLSGNSSQRDTKIVICQARRRKRNLATSTRFSHPGTLQLAFHLDYINSRLCSRTTRYLNSTKQR